METERSIETTRYQRKKSGFTVPEVVSDVNKLCAIKLGKITDFFNENGVDVRIIGSVGRSLSMSSQLPNMQENPEPGKTYKDIDLLVIGRCEDKNPIIANLFKSASKIARPFPLEISKFIEASDKGTFIHYRNLKYEISPKVFKKHEVKLGDRIIPTLDPNTLFHLPALYPKMRIKDFKDAFVYGRSIRSKYSKRDILPEELFKPFHELMKKKKELYRMDTYVFQMRNLYVRYFPIISRRLLDLG